jgi:hypothetical protein
LPVPEPPSPPVPLPLPLLPLLPEVPPEPSEPEPPDPLLDPLPEGPTATPPPDELCTPPDPLHAVSDRKDAAIRLASSVCLMMFPETMFRITDHSLSARTSTPALRRLGCAG